MSIFIYIGNLAWKVSGDRVANAFIAFCLQKPKNLSKDKYITYSFFTNATEIFHSLSYY